MRLIFLTVVLVFGAWAAGVRVHPEVAPGYFQIFFQKDYRKVELRNGRIVTGEFLSEKDGRIELSSGGKVYSFGLTEIVRTSQIGPVDIYRAMKDATIPLPKGTPLIAYRKEEGVFAPGRRVRIHAPS